MMLPIEKLMSEKYKGPKHYEIKTCNIQYNVEEIVNAKFEKCLDCCNMLSLNRELILSYVLKMIKKPPHNYTSLDSSKSWICFWALHSMELLGYRPDDKLCDSFINFLAACQHPNGGFGGSPQDYSHLGATYSAISALVILGQYNQRAYSVINRKTLKEFIGRCRIHDGSFRMAVDQEADLRAIYCAISVCRLTNIYSHDLFKNTDTIIASCQNYDGGLGCEKGTESNGGYTFCGYASLVLMNKEEAINRDKLLNWASHRQMSMEGGFQGRTCKLVDSCYSYWVGALFQIIQGNLLIDTDILLKNLCNREALQYFLLICCQTHNGGMTDRPMSSPDLYHTCYSLSGLSLSQYSAVEESSSDVIVGLNENRLIPNHPIYNITMSAVKAAIGFFQLQPSV